MSAVVDKLFIPYDSYKKKKKDINALCLWKNEQILSIVETYGDADTQSFVWVSWYCTLLLDRRFNFDAEDS